MALLILIAALWLVVLTPSFIKKRTQRQSVGSIDHFHHQLHLLERAGPKLMQPAYSLQRAESSNQMAVGASGFPAISSSSRRPNLVLLKPVSDHDAVGTDGGEEIVDAAGGHFLRVGPPTIPEPSTMPETISLADPDRLRRELALKRRRDTLGIVLGTTVVTGLLGIYPSFHILWVATIAGVLALGGYVGLTVYARRLTASRPAPAPMARAARGGGSVAAVGGGGSERGWDGDPFGDDAHDADDYVEPRRVAASR